MLFHFLGSDIFGPIAINEIARPLVLLIFHGPAGFEFLEVPADRRLVAAVFQDALVELNGLIKFAIIFRQLGLGDLRSQALIFRAVDFLQRLVQLLGESIQVLSFCL